MDKANEIVALKGCVADAFIQVCAIDHSAWIKAEDAAYGRDFLGVANDEKILAGIEAVWKYAALFGVVGREVIEFHISARKTACPAGGLASAKPPLRPPSLLLEPNAYAQAARGRLRRAANG
jgi:hypothetical protein